MSVARDGCFDDHVVEEVNKSLKRAVVGGWMETSDKNNI